MEKTDDKQTRNESKTQLAEQIKLCLRSGDYSRALGLLQGAAVAFPNDLDFSEQEALAHDGLKRNAEANRLITESQELFAQQKSTEAIQLLRKAYELDKNNSLARAILANALVEHAQSIVANDWLEAETLANQALDLNPAHPTAKTIRSLVVENKKTSSVEDWVAQARKRQSGGDLFAALAWVAEGLAVHPDDPKLVQIQDEIQRDQAARRRQTRRGDLEDLRRMASKINAASDDASKRALAERIQAVAATYWTDGEILSIANALLLRLGLVPQEGSSASSHRKGSTVIFHVPRTTVPEAPRANTSQLPPSSDPPSGVSANPVSLNQGALDQPALNQAAPKPVTSSQVLPSQIPPSEVPSEPISSGRVATSIVQPIKVPQSKVSPSKAPGKEISSTPPVSQLGPPAVATVLAAETSVPAVRVAKTSSRRKRSSRSNSTTLILVTAAAIILFATVIFFARKRIAPQVATPATAPSVSVPTVSTPSDSASTNSVPTVSAPAQIPEPSLSALPLPSDTAGGKLVVDDRPPTGSVQDRGTLLILADQDNAKVFLNGKVLRQLTRSGQLRLPNLEPKDYVVQVSKGGFQDPPQQKIRIRNGEQARLVFSLQPQPQPRLASLSIQGGAPGTMVLIDQTSVGSIQPDGSLSVSTINPGDHTIELRKERFKPRQLKRHFVMGGAVSLAAADAVLESVPGELKITFAPADAKVAIVKGELLNLVSSGVPLSLPPGTYTLTARTADSFTRSSTLEVIAGQSRTLDLSLSANGMSKWDDPGSWKHEGDSFIRKGGDFVLYGVVPASGTFVFSATPIKGRLLQWVVNYTDPRNYVLFQMDGDNFYRTVVRNGQKTDQVKVPDKADKKNVRMLHIRVSPTEIVHQIRHGYTSTVLDRWTQPGANLSLGKFGFYIPGNDQIALTGFAHYVDLNLR